MNKSDNYKETDLCSYQCIISKLMYFAYNIKSDIAFTVGQYNKYNFDPRKSHL